MYNAWGNVPEAGKLQIVTIALALETAIESKKPHYMRVRFALPPLQSSREPRAPSPASRPLPACPRALGPSPPRA